MTTPTFSASLEIAGHYFTAIIADNEAILAAGFLDTAGMLGRLGCAMTLRTAPPDHPVAKALRSYAEGDPSALDTVRTEQPGGPFMQRSWAAMRKVSAGDTITYSELASRAGNPRAVRAAGSSCARNLIALIVPCHRILPISGGVGHYYYGSSIKEDLLKYEAR